MRQSKFTETQIVSILKEADAGRPVNEIWRKYGISSATYYKSKAKYGGLEASDVKRLKELEHENGRLKRSMPICPWRTPRSKMSSQKSSTACWAAGGRHTSGDGEWPSGSAGLSCGWHGTSHVLSVPGGLGATGCAGDRGADDARGGQESLGLLEVL